MRREVGMSRAERLAEVLAPAFAALAFEARAEAALLALGLAIALAAAPAKRARAAEVAEVEPEAALLAGEAREAEALDTTLLLLPPSTSSLSLAYPAGRSQEVTLVAMCT